MSGDTSILLVEDDDLVRRSVAITLKSHGFTVTDVANAKAAAELLSKSVFSLVITDVWMPERTGIDLLKAVRADNNPVPFIFISGGNSAEPLELTIGRAEAHGAVEFLMKPFEDEELLQAVEKVRGAP